MRRTLAKFGLPFEKDTPLVHFPKALKRPRNNAGPASQVYFAQISFTDIQTFVSITQLQQGLIWISEVRLESVVHCNSNPYLIWETLC